MPRPFRFAVQSFSATSAKEWRERARRVEALGYATLHLADHVIGPGPALAKTNHPVQELAAVPAIAAAAEATTTLRVGCRVFCVDYRQPALLAKEAATLDLLSDGRLELGLGAGWLQAEYEAIGLRSTRPPCASRASRRRSRRCARRSAASRSRSRVSTCGSRASPRARSRCSARTRR